jgi:hypothetical protein
MTDDRVALPTIEIDLDAAVEIRGHGGYVYVWADGAGVKHVRYQPPKDADAKEWTRLDADGVRVFVDQGIQPPEKWVIALRHVPYRHVTALYNGYVPGAGSAGMTAPHSIDR